MEPQKLITRFLVRRTQEANLSEQFFVTLRANWEQVKTLKTDIDGPVAERVQKLLHNGAAT
jgi:hypothetical protein